MMKPDRPPFNKVFTEFARMYGRAYVHIFFILLAACGAVIYAVIGFAILRLFNVADGSDLEMYLMLSLFLVPLAVWYAWAYYR